MRRYGSIASNVYALRREQAQQRILKCSQQALIIVGHSLQIMTNDIPYPFHQKTDILYLSNYREPESMLILKKNAFEMYVRSKDKERELWDGSRVGLQGAKELFQVDKAYDIQILKETLPSILENIRHIYVDKMNSYSPHYEILFEICKSMGITLELLKNQLAELRLYKRDEELQTMKKSAEMSAEAFKRLLKFAQSGMNEYHLHSHFEYQCKMLGAQMLAYPPVFASGINANTLHYIANNKSIGDGELVLMDAGCEYNDYASDITRTFPINGRYSEAQAQLYSAVLNVQKKCIQLIQDHELSLNQLHIYSVRFFMDELKRLYLVQKLSNSELLQLIERIYPHHVGHYLGMDTHDTPEISRDRPLEKRMVFTVEPGIYIPKDLDCFPPEYRGIGIRIEDDVAIENNGCVTVLSKNAPKEIDEIEHIMIS